MRELRATVTLDEEDLRALIAEIQRPLVKLLTERLDALARAVASVPPSAPPPPPSAVDYATKGVQLTDAERLKARDLRTALLLGKVPDKAGLLIDTKVTSQLLNVSPRTLSRLDQLGAIPQPVRVGQNMIRWRLAEILAWIDAGCPPR
jgi:predicted DNA-binding transcriptional regulator AlpA